MSLRLFEKIRLFLRAPALVDRLSVSYRRKRLSISTNSSAQAIPRRLLLDVSVISRLDAGTGIQRVVRAVFNELLEVAGERFVLCPVAATRKRPYSYAIWNGVGLREEIGHEVVIKQSDIFLGLDFSTHAVVRHFHQLSAWKRSGANLYFIVHDLLPEEHPEWFSTVAVIAYRRWIKAVAVLSSGIFCNSLDTEMRLLNYFKDRFALIPSQIPTSVLPMGWDIAPARSMYGLTRDYSNILTRVRQETSALMVGTLEPRKGHAQVLAAFNQLWQSDVDCNLVIIGRSGWKTEMLQNEIVNHREFNRRLFWLDEASDETLLEFYRACDGVIIASLAEGYGLPMIEAIGHGKPILARDLSVFREQVRITGMDAQPQSVQSVEFFSTTNGLELASVIRKWLNNIRAGSIMTADNLRYPTWKDTANSLLNGLDGDSKSTLHPFGDQEISLS